MFSDIKTELPMPLPRGREGLEEIGHGERRERAAAVAADQHQAAPPGPRRAPLLVHLRPAQGLAMGARAVSEVPVLGGLEADGGVRQQLPLQRQQLVRGDDGRPGRSLPGHTARPKRMRGAPGEVDTTTLTPRMKPVDELGVLRALVSAAAEPEKRFSRGPGNAPITSGQPREDLGTGRKSKQIPLPLEAAYIQRKITHPWK